MIKKVLVVGSGKYNMYAPAWVRGLEELGIETAFFDYDSHWRIGAISRLEKRLMLGPSVSEMNRAVVTAANAFAPDVILLYAALPIWAKTVQALATNFWVATYNNDDPLGNSGSRIFLRHFRRSLLFAHSHHVYREKTQADYEQLGASHVKVLYSYYLPWADTPPSLTSTEKAKFGHDIVFVGHAEDDNRIGYVETLISAGLSLTIYGSNNRHGWRSHLSSEVHNQLKPIVPVVGEDYRKVIAASKICLCFLSQANRDEYTRRVFEIPAVGGFLLCERTDVMQTLYHEDKEAVYFSSGSELLEKCKFYLEKDAERQKIAQAGHERCIKSGYDVISRMRQWMTDTSNWKSRWDSK